MKDSREIGFAEGQEGCGVREGMGRKEGRKEGRKDARKEGRKANQS